jgi:uncharacterized membrane protein YfhO
MLRGPRFFLSLIRFVLCGVCLALLTRAAMLSAYLMLITGREEFLENSTLLQQLY